MGMASGGGLPGLVPAPPPCSPVSAPPPAGRGPTLRGCRPEPGWGRGWGRSPPQRLGAGRGWGGIPAAGEAGRRRSGRPGGRAGGVAPGGGSPLPRRLSGGGRVMWPLTVPRLSLLLWLLCPGLAGQVGAPAGRCGRWGALEGTRAQRDPANKSFGVHQPPLLTAAGWRGAYGEGRSKGGVGTSTLVWGETLGTPNATLMWGDWGRHSFQPPSMIHSLHPTL